LSVTLFSARWGEFLPGRESVYAAEGLRSAIAHVRARLVHYAYMTKHVETQELAAWRVPGARKPLAAPLPMTRAAMDDRGWDACDVILVTGDAYVDHPSFGVALIGRFLEWLGYRVGIIAQPDPDDVEAFRVLGPPVLCWGVTAGNLDSNLMRSTIMRKPRHDDAYTPGGHAGRRPANASIVYTSRVRQAYKGVPVILGGVEASLRRFAYYDFWTDKVRRSLLVDTKADLIAFGMAERAFAEILHRLRAGEGLSGIRGTVELVHGVGEYPHVELPAFEAVSVPTPAGKRAYAQMARDIDRHTSPDDPAALTQRHGDRWIVAHPPAVPLAPRELDALYLLPFTRAPHPAYGSARIPAFDMIKDSVTTHRGCYAGCTFCAIGAHQGTTIVSRSMDNILEELHRLTRAPHFHGTVSDLGGPTANMYRTGCKKGRARCPGKSCLYPRICPNLETGHGPLLSLLRQARKVPGVKHCFVSSGIRFDLALSAGGKEYIETLARYHVSGRLKIAPEHVSPGVLSVMRKPALEQYREFVTRFQTCARTARKPHQVVEYFISGHPGCTLADMVELALYLRREHITPEQVQDFYPAPLTLAAAMYYTGLDPLTMQPVHTATGEREKTLQRALLLCHKPEFHAKAREALREAGREELIGTLVPAEAGTPPPQGQRGVSRTGTTVRKRGG
jgi:uncharacterized radical SAM protein YgiQ